jgi:hypothetical protein
MVGSLAVSLVAFTAQSVRGAARPLIWNLRRVGRRVRLVRAGGGYAGKLGTSAQGGLTGSQSLAEPEHGAAMKHGYLTRQPPVPHDPNHGWRT